MRIDADPPITVTDSHIVPQILFESMPENGAVIGSLDGLIHRRRQVNSIMGLAAPRGIFSKRAAWRISPVEIGPPIRTDSPLLGRLPLSRNRPYPRIDNLLAGRMRQQRTDIRRQATARGERIVTPAPARHFHLQRIAPLDQDFWQRYGTGIG